MGGRSERIQPFLSVLFATAVGTADQGMGRSAKAHDLAAGRVEDDGFGALSAAIDAEEQVLLGHEGVLSIIVGR
jgi:hypothetical protein